MNVILVAFGPKAATQQAVRRLKRVPLVRSVWVVAANERHVGTVRGLTGVEVVEAVGSRGVRSVSAELGDAPVLLIHDDVCIGARGISTMLRVLDEGADVVAPHSNEVDTPQFIGALPAAADAASTIDRIGDLGDPRRIDAARHSCILAKGSTLASLGGTLIVPGSSVVRSHARIMLAPMAVAHDLSCHGRLVTEVGPEPLLVASMIVRDEEAQLADAIESVRDLVDRVEICDTGSVDETISVALSAGANVRQIEWRNDFGWARNQALDACRDADFFLHIDADERVVVDDAPLFRRWLKTWRDELHGVLIELRNHRDHGQSASSHRAMRIAQTKDAYWLGALHESIRFPATDDHSVVFYLGISIDHYGYQSEIVDAKDKAARNIEISRVAFEAERSIKTTIDYARSLRMADQNDEESVRLFREALDQVSPGPLPTIRSYLLSVVGAADLAAGHVDDAIDRALEALEITPREDVALTTIAHAFARQGRWAELTVLAEDLRDRPSAAPMFAVEANIVRFDTFVARALAECGRIDEAVRALVEAFDKDALAAGEVASDVVESLVRGGVSDAQLVELMASAGGEIFIQQLASVVAPPITAAVALAALETGATHPSLFTTGFAASLIRPVDDVTDRLMAHQHLASEEHRAALSDMARRRNRPDLEAALVSTAPSRGWDLTLVGGSGA